MTRYAVWLLAGSLVLGVLQGWIWSRLAPGVQYQIFPNQSWAAAPTETQHNFVAFGLFAVAGLFVGGAIATAAWSFRAVRGTVMLLVCAISAGAASVLAGLLGVAWAGGVDPASAASVAGVQEIVTAPAVLTGWPAHLAAPTAAVIVYTFLVSWNGLPNLGRART